MESNGKLNTLAVPSENGCDGGPHAMNRAWSYMSEPDGKDQDNENPPEGDLQPPITYPETLRGLVRGSKHFWSQIPWTYTIHRGKYINTIRTYVMLVFSGHGLVHCFTPTAGRFRKAVWVAIFSILVYIMCRNTVLTGINYLDHPKTVTVQVVDEEIVDFPAITICNYNVLSKSRIKEQIRRDRTGLRSKLEEVVNIEERFLRDFNAQNKRTTLGPTSICKKGQESWRTPSTLVADQRDEQPWPYAQEELIWNAVIKQKKALKLLDESAGSGLQNSSQLLPTFNPCKEMHRLGVANGFNVTDMAKLQSWEEQFGKSLQDGHFKLPAPSRALRCSSDGQSFLGVRDSVLAEICEKAGYDRTTHRPCLNSYLSSEGIPSNIICFAINRMCDGVKDCDAAAGDYTDESVYCDKTTGKTRCDQVDNMSTCKDGTCYDSSWRCNGFEACPDGSDEEGCPEMTYDDHCDCLVRCEVNAKGKEICYPIDEFKDSDKLNLERVMWRSKSRNFKTLVSRALSPTPEEIRKFGIRARDFIVSCSFDGKPCSYKDFFKWQNQDFGNCFTFNSPLLANDTGTHDKIYRTKKFGYKNGLRLNLNIEPRDYLSAVMPVKGVRIQIHNRYRVPFPAVLGFDVSPLTKTSIALERRLIHRAPNPYGRCSRLNEDAFRRRFNYNYSYHACMEICRETVVRKKCGCSKLLNQVYRTYDPPFCQHTNPKQRTCVDESTSLFNAMDHGIREIAGDGCRRCDPACNELVFYPHISEAVPNKQSMFANSKIHEEFVSGDFCEQDDSSLKANNRPIVGDSGTVLVQVHLNNLQQSVVVEEPAYSFLQFISNIGGIWGLFAGFSLLTFIQCMELGFNLLLTWYAGFKRMMQARKESI